MTATILQEFWQGARVRQGATGTDMFTAVIGLVGRNKRRYGGYIVHAGVVLIFLGFAGEGFSRGGFEMVGVDIDPVLIAAAERDHPGPTWRARDLAELDLSPSTLQFEVTTSQGRALARTDFAWEEERLVEESGLPYVLLRPSFIFGPAAISMSPPSASMPPPASASPPASMPSPNTTRTSPAKTHRHEK